ncbi:MAG: hypothetical protein MJ238_01825 [Bacilli bacterium]|nr:hypothetical protein [Bacilli bacterium]
MDVWNSVVPENKKINEINNDTFYDCVVEAYEIANLSYNVGFCYKPLFFNDGLPIDSMEDSRTLTILKSVLFEFDFSNYDIAPHPYFVGKKVDALLNIVSIGCSDKNISDRTSLGYTLIMQKDGRMACFDALSNNAFLNEDDVKHYLSHFDRNYSGEKCGEVCRFSSLDFRVSSEESLMLGLLPHELKYSILEVDYLDNLNAFGRTSFSFSRCFSKDPIVSLDQKRGIFEVDMDKSVNCAENVSIALPSASSIFKSKFIENVFDIVGEETKLYEEEDKNDNKTIRYTNRKNACQTLEIKWSSNGYRTCGHEGILLNGYKNQKRRYGIFPTQLVMYSLHDLSDSYQTLCMSMYSSRFYTNVDIVEY